jgi:hypothetical protein
MLRKTLPPQSKTKAHPELSTVLIEIILISKLILSCPMSLLKSSWFQSSSWAVHYPYWNHPDFKAHPELSTVLIEIILISKLILSCPLSLMKSSWFQSSSWAVLLPCWNRPDFKLFLKRPFPYWFHPEIRARPELPDSVCASTAICATWHLLRCGLYLANHNWHPVTTSDVGKTYSQSDEHSMRWIYVKMRLLPANTAVVIELK